MAVNGSRIITLDRLEQFNNKLPKHIEKTQAEYDALPDSKYTDGNIYFITDAKVEIEGTNVKFDNTDTDIKSTTVEDAIKEVNTKFDYATDDNIDDMFDGWDFPTV